MPKLVIFRVARSVDWLARIFDRSRSRWMTPFWCACWVASQTAMKRPVFPSSDCQFFTRCVAKCEPCSRPSQKPVTKPPQNLRSIFTLRFSSRKTTTSGTAGMRPRRGLTPTHSIRRPASLDHQSKAPRNQALHGRPSLRILGQRRFAHRLLHFKAPYGLIRHRGNCLVNINRHLLLFAHSITARKEAPLYPQNWV